jgi:hypothetical protein
VLAGCASKKHGALRQMPESSQRQTRFGSPGGLAYMVCLCEKPTIYSVISASIAAPCEKKYELNHKSSTDFGALQYTHTCPDVQAK